MIVLVYPSDARPLDDALAVAQQIADARPLWGVLALVPFGTPTPRRSRVTFVPAPIALYAPELPGRPLRYDAGWHDALLRRIGVDLVWCEQIGIGGHLKHAGDAVYRQNGRPLVAAVHALDVEQLDEPRTLAHLLGALQADYNIWRDDRQRAEWLVRCATWANDAALDALSVGDVLATGRPGGGGAELDELLERLERRNVWNFDDITAPDALAFVAERLDKFSGATTREFFTAIARKEVNGRMPFSNQSMPPTRIIRTVRHLGGRVAMLNGEQRVYAPGR